MTESAQTEAGARRGGSSGRGEEASSVVLRGRAGGRGRHSEDWRMQSQVCRFQPAPKYCTNPELSIESKGATIRCERFESSGVLAEVGAGGAVEL